jgi:dihydropteroate synthase
MAETIWEAGRFQIDISRPCVMGIVNVTPDSFSDGGDYFDSSAAMVHCDSLLKQGAGILDIGGESSRPGAMPLALDEELKRVLPVLRHAVRLNVPVSIDTYKPEVMRAALDVGVDIVNDIYALRRPGAEEVISRHSSCGVCLMHMRGEPITMQQDVGAVDIVGEVKDFLSRRLQALIALGVDQSRVAIDPGIGFGKSVEHNFELLRKQASLLELERPLLVGWSRKSSLGAVSGRPANERGILSAAAALAAVQLGARIIRVHDVADTVDALKIWALAGLLPEGDVGVDTGSRVGSLMGTKP